NVSPRAQVSGDQQYLYVVEVDSNGNATGSMVLRAEDGVAVKGVPDFSAAYQNRLRSFGRRLLVRDNVQGSVALRLYDVLTGKDVWKQTFPADSVVLRSEDPNLTGAVAPDGAVTIIDLRTQETILKTRTAFREHVEKLQEAHLLLDNDKYYLALNKSPNAQLNQWGGTMTNVMYGLRAIIVKGWLYAFDRATGKAAWWHKAENQMIIMEQFRDLPIVQFTARYHKPINRLGNAAQMVPFRSLHKRTGKLL